MERLNAVPVHGKGANHDQKSRRRLQSGFREGQKSRRTVQNQSRSSKTSEASGVFQTQRILRLNANASTDRVQMREIGIFLGTDFDSRNQNRSTAKATAFPPPKQSA